MELQEGHVWRANLDADGVFGGLQETAIEELKPGDLVVCPHDQAPHLPADVVHIGPECDCQPGAMRWDRARGTFHPVQDDLVSVFATMLELGMALALSRMNEPGPLGRYARDFYGLAAKHFPEQFALHARKEPPA